MGLINDIYAIQANVISHSKEFHYYGSTLECMQKMATAMSVANQAVVDRSLTRDALKSMKRSTGRQGGTNVDSKDATSLTVKFRGSKSTRRHIWVNATLGAHSRAVVVPSMRKAS